jgi:hypothetical protein
MAGRIDLEHSTVIEFAAGHQRAPPPELFALPFIDHIERIPIAIELRFGIVH